MSHNANIGLIVVHMLNLSAQLLVAFQVNHLKDDHKVDMHNGSTFNHRYVKSNPHEVENATWMLTVMVIDLYTAESSK